MTNSEQSNSSEKKVKFDTLQLYFGEDYKVTEKIVIHQPTIGDIIRYGEDFVYGTVNVFVGNTTSYRLPLWEAGIDWNKISDFELFCLLIPNLTLEQTSLFFGDIDFKKFILVTEQNDEDLQEDEKEKQEAFLYNPEQDIEIREETYLLIREYVRKMFNIYPKVEKARGKTTKEWMIDEERQKRDMQRKKDAESGANTSSLLPLISACLNHPGFKYSKKELKEVGIIEFMDSVQRLQVYESTRALLSGTYSGFCDTSKIDKDNFNFMRSIDNK